MNNTNSDDKQLKTMCLKNAIATRVKEVKGKRGKNRTAIFNDITTLYESFLRIEMDDDKTKPFTKELIYQAYPFGKVGRSTAFKHLKIITQTLIKKGVLRNDKSQHTVFKRQIRQLQSKDGGSYALMMKFNGYTTKDYYKFYQDSDGIPRKKHVGTSTLTGDPIGKDKKVLSGEEWDLVVLRETKPRSKQNVESYGNKSIVFNVGKHKINDFYLM